MTLRTRRVLFYSLLLLFIVFGAGAVFYSRGWRINTDNCEIKSLQGCKIKLQKTGAIFIATKPQGVTIKIDGKSFKDKSGLVQSGTLIGNLLPHSYRIFVSKDGYEPWEKDFQVLPEFVAEARKIILVPKEITREQIAIKRFRGDHLLDFSSDGNKLITEDTIRKIYYLYDLNNLDSVFNINVNFQNLKTPTPSGVGVPTASVGKDGLIKKIVFHPFDPDKLIIETNSGLYILDVARIQLENLSLTHSIDSGLILSKVEGLKRPLIWATRSPNIYYIEASKNPTHTLTSFNLVVKAKTATYDLTVNPDAQISALSLSISQNKIAYLTSLNDLYVLDIRDGSLKKIAHNAGLFAFSPDSKKIAFLDNNCDTKAIGEPCFSGPINIYFIESGDGNLRERTGETITLYPKGVVSIRNIAWYRDSAHFLVQYFGEDKKQRIDFVEIDDRSPLNQEKLIGDVSSFYYDHRLNPVYYLLENGLYFFEIEK